jgi:hypothetical protein
MPVHISDLFVMQDATSDLRTDFLTKCSVMSSMPTPGQEWDPMWS